MERLRPGSRLGAYRLTRLIGEGGMGVVFEAQDDRLGRRVAIKVIRGHGSPTAKARFEREIVAASRVRHPNVVAVHASGTEGDVRFLVSDFVVGEPLSAVLRREGALGIERAAAIGEKLARALHALHEAGVLHRDVKPENVLMDERGEPRLTDFGIARLADSERLTKTNQMLGTPAYAPLEQLGGGGADTRADIYGLGATLYHMVAGRTPYGADTLMGLIASKERRVAPPSSSRADGDARLDAVCVRCLEPRPAERFADAAELAAALAKAPATEARVETGRRRPVALVALVALAVLGVAAAVAALLGGGASARTVADPAVELQETVAARRGSRRLRGLELADVASRLATLAASGAGDTAAARSVRAWVGLAAAAHGDLGTAAAWAAALGSDAAPEACALRGRVARSRGDPAAAARELERASRGGLELPELTLWRLEIGLERAVRPADAAGEILGELRRLRARADLGDEGVELEVRCLAALGRAEDARNLLATLDAPPPGLAWSIALLTLDEALHGQATPREALAAVASVTRPDGPLDEGERRRAGEALRLVELRLSALRPDTVFEIAQYLTIVARVAPGLPLTPAMHDALRDLLGRPIVVGATGALLGSAAAALVADDADEIVFRAMRLNNVMVANTPQAVALARRVLAGGVAEHRVEALDVLCGALVAQKQWKAAAEAATELEKELERATPSSLGENQAGTLAARVVFVRATAARAEGHAAAALRGVDGAPELENYLKDGFALVRIEALLDLGRKDDALEAGLRFVAGKPFPGRYGLPLAEIVWRLARDAGRTKGLKPIFDIEDAWGSKDPIWAVRGAVVLAETGEAERAAKRYRQVRAAMGLPMLEEGLSRGSPAALAELRALEKRLAPNGQ